MGIPEIIATTIGCLIIACGIIIFIFFLLGFITFVNIMHRKESLDRVEESPYVGALGPNLKEFNEYKDDCYNALKGTSFSWESIKAEDGIRLFGRLYKTEGATKTVICLPGYLTSAVKSFAPIVPFYRENGFNVLLVASRGQAESGGRWVTFGAKESKDLLAWIEHVNDIYPSGEVFLHGIDIGANASMLVSSEVPSNVKGIIADSGYTKAWDIFVYQIKQIHHLAPFPILHIAEFFSKRIVKVNHQASAYKAVESSKVPILFIHGSKDMFVPPYMCKACYESCTAPKQLLIVEGAAHAQAEFKDSEAYRSALIGFVNSVSKAE